MIEKIEKDNKILAIIIRASYSDNGVHFYTPNDFSQQLAFMKHPKNTLIDAHTHNIVLREVSLTQEVLVIRKGKIKVYLYDENRNFIESHILLAGDIILLAHGGHGFECIEDVEMVEVKQGPYLGEKDKVRFDGLKRDIGK